MKELNFEQVLGKVTLAIKNSKNRIYATHFMKNQEDLLLPKAYLKSLIETKCNNRKRIIFGNKDLFEKFKIQDEYFVTFFSEQYYIRMVLIDDEVFFKIDENFYNSSDKYIVKLLEQYYIKTINGENNNVLVNQFLQMIKNLSI